MGKVTTQVFYAGLAVILSAGFAHADIVGSIFENDVTGSQNAIPANVPGTTPNVTFDISGTTTIFFTSGSLYTIGEFLNSEKTNVPGSSVTVLTGSGELGNTLNNTLFNFTGTVSVTNTQSFQAGHDDGLTLTIGSNTVISAPGGTSFALTTGTYTGSTGTFPFQLVYGESFGPPGDIEISGLALVSPPPSVPLPGALPLFATGLGVLGLLGWRKKRKAAA